MHCSLERRQGDQSTLVFGSSSMQPKRKTASLHIVDKYTAGDRVHLKADGDPLGHLLLRCLVSVHDCLFVDDVLALGRLTREAIVAGSASTMILGSERKVKVSSQ